MAETDCVIIIPTDENKPSANMEKDCTPAKKFKQGRLPFKPLDSSQSPQQGSTPPSSKKRKLSDNESPSAKHPKIVSIGANKPSANDCDPEVSSSSEAESGAIAGHSKGAKKLNTLDRFFKTKQELREAEISSTNECIDLTETMDTEDADCVAVNKTKSEGKDVKVEDVDKEKPDDVGETMDTEDADCVAVNKTKSERKGVKVEDVDKEKPDDVGDDSQASMKSDDASDANNIKTEDEVSSQESSEDDKSEDEDAEKGEKIEDEADVNSSFVSDTSVCEDALKTPAKGSSDSMLLKTPTVQISPLSRKTPVSVKKSDSDIDKTPASAKRSKLSEKKRKEREEERLKKKAEKEKELEEKKKMKEEKEKERLEKKKQREAEKAEKEKQRLEEKEKKEKERLEKLQQKEEEKKAKERELEAKAEEKRKKEEERRQKEEEKRIKEEEKRKEEEEKAKKEEKKKSFFKGFFIQKDPSDSPPKAKDTKSSFFMPFEVKPNMKLAPSQRRDLTDEQKSSLDDLIGKQGVSELYTSQLKAGIIKPGVSRSTWPRKLGDEDDIEILSHEKETIEKVTYRAKFLKFYENTRPAYYGTWSKTSARLSARNPFKQDKELFDYEVDSDDEWEEEEPGESVSSDEEEDEAEKVDGDEDDDGWMVPHGYLSDDEGIPDDEADNVSKQDIQKVRQAAWESELKRQAKALKMFSIGCVWHGTTTEIAAQQLETLLKYKAVCLSDGPISTSYTPRSSCEAGTDKQDKSDDQKPVNKQARSVPEEAMPDLIRMLHGNPCGLKKLIKEFSFYWRQKTNPEKVKTAASSTANQSLDAETMEVDEVDDKLKEKPATSSTDASPETNNKIGKSIISKRQLEIKIPLIAEREKRPDQKRTLWYVKEEILQQYNMKDIQLPNSWQYVCIKEPLWAMEKVTPKAEDAAAVSKTPTGRATPNILQFTQPMLPSQIQAIAVGSGSSKDPMKDTPNASNTPEAPKAPVATLKPVKTIKDMFSPVSQKEKQPGKSKTPENVSTPKDEAGTSASLPSNAIVDCKKEVLKVKPVAKSPAAKPLANSPALKPVTKSPAIKPVKNKEPPSPGDALSTPPCKKRASSVFETVITSPELMKGSPKTAMVSLLNPQTSAKPVEVIEID